MKNFTIIIPIFNETDSIFTLVDEIKKEFKGQIPEIIIVDDGSTDNFVEKMIKFNKNNPVSYTHLTLPTTPYV